MLDPDFFYNFWEGINKFYFLKDARMGKSYSRVLSKNRIIKNQLRLNMLDKWLSNMLIPSLEIDVLNTIPYEEIMIDWGENHK